jgi:hypothetical protein
MAGALGRADRRVLERKPQKQTISEFIIVSPALPGIGVPGIERRRFSH